MYCNQCGKENRDGARFCFCCGSKLMEQVGQNEKDIFTGLAVKTGERSVENENERNDDKNTEAPQRNTGSTRNYICPFCKSSHVERKKREGCLTWFGEIIGGWILYGILEAVGWDNLADLYAKILPFLLIVSLVYVIYQKTKPNWKWVMHCMDCDKEFEYDSVTGETEERL